MAALSKTLTKTDIETRLTLKSSCLPYLPRFKDGQRLQVLKVEDETGEEWSFNLIIRNGKYKKPVLSHGWRAFVKKNKLEIGDQVQLFIEGFRYKIRVKKAQKVVMLFGAVISD